MTETPAPEVSGSRKDGHMEAYKPSSWADDLNSYRQTVGTRAMATLKETKSDDYFRVPRTTLCPLGNVRHPLYPYGDEPFVPDERNGGHFRYDRHGWGDDTLLKEEGIPPGTLHRHAQECPSGRRPGPPEEEFTPGRKGLFGLLQMTEQGGTDSWIGNRLVDPTKGKRATPAPADKKGRVGLFATLGQTDPCLPKDDTWLGNILVDPAKGKAYAPGPEKRLGRKDLYGIVQQAILREPDAKAKMFKGGDGALTDAWVGNRLVHPNMGRLPGASELATRDNMFGPALGPHVPNTDFPRIGKATVSLETTPMQHTINRVGPILNGTSDYDDWSGGRSMIPWRPEVRPKNLDGRDSMYPILQNKDVSPDEAKLWRPARSDAPAPDSKRHLPVPGAVHPCTGIDMLTWRPDERIGNFVPYGKVAQEQRNLFKSTRPHRRTVFREPGPKNATFGAAS